MSSLSLSFNDVNFSPVEHDNQIWLTASELAKALGYKKSDAVTQIYERKADEFTSEMTTTLKLSVVRKTGVVEMENRIFNARGCHLIAMFAKTEVAKQFREWALDVLDKAVGKPIAFVKEQNDDEDIKEHLFSFIKGVDASFEQIQSLLNVSLDHVEDHSNIHNLLLVAQEKVELWQNYCIDELSRFNNQEAKQ